MLDRIFLAAFALLTASVSLAADPIEVPLQNSGFEDPWPPADATDKEAQVRGVDMYTHPGRDGLRDSVVWSHDGHSHPVPVNGDTRVLDVLDNPIPVSDGTNTADIEPVHVIDLAR